jgi:hypothetical protein
MGRMTMVSVAYCRNWLPCIGVLCASVVAGCGGSGYKVAPDIARPTLIQVLDHWKAGGEPESLRTERPEIVVQDFDWIGGAKLVDYEVLGDGEPRDANLVVQVKLTLQDAKEKESSKVVTYLVSTAPKRTVFRDPFQ